MITHFIKHIMMPKYEDKRKEQEQTQSKTIMK